MAKPTNQQPRISVNKLAEFMSAKGARQRQILKDQKYPTDFKGMYYREASEATGLVLASSIENIDPLSRAISVLDQMAPEKIGTQRRIQANIDALESFQAMLDTIDLGGAPPRLGEFAPPKLTIHGVSISVRPEIVLNAKGKSGTPLVGAVKVHFSRTFSLTKDGAGYVSAVLQEWCKGNLSDDGSPSGPLCPVIDVGSREFHPGVKSTVARMRDIEAECQSLFDNQFSGRLVEVAGRP